MRQDQFPIYRFAALLAAAVSLFTLASQCTAAQPDLPMPPGAPAGEEQEGVETLTQGPIHEAFANPSDLDPAPGPVVMKQPPQDVKEEPPEYMPEGDYAWFPGYWVWDEERDDFIWVTGVARKAPPGMRFVSGYWTEAEGGWQRVAGFWISTDVAQVEYRQPPPNSLEVGPSSPQPADNYFWIPGSWAYYDTGYRWRTGYWSPYQPDWIWCPARWVWTPGGFVYLPGYWDFRLALRGQIFAPVYFRNAVYARPNWTYRPWCVVPTNNLFIHLWIRPNFGHYYFGNYYGPQYANRGFISWCNVPAQRHHYDPFFTYCGVHYRRQGIDFIGRCQGWHEYYVQHADQRPQRTWHEQQQFAGRAGPGAKLETQLVARNIVEVAKRDDGPVKLTRLDDRTRQQQVERTEKFRELKDSRKKVEHAAGEVVAKLPKTGPKTGETVRDSTETRDKLGSLPDLKDDNAKGKEKNIDKKSKVDSGSVLRTASEIPKLTLPKDADAGKRTSDKGKVGVDKMRTKITTGGNNDIPPPMPDATEKSKRDKVTVDSGDSATRGKNLPKEKKLDTKSLPDANANRDGRGRVDQPQKDLKNVLPGQNSGGKSTGDSGSKPNNLKKDSTNSKTDSKKSIPQVEKKLIPQVEKSTIDPRLQPRVVPRVETRKDTTTPKIDAPPKVERDKGPDRGNG
jgi:hypothetical protein